MGFCTFAVVCMLCGINNERKPVDRPDKSTVPILSDRGQLSAHFAVPVIPGLGPGTMETSDVGNGWKRVRLTWKVPARTPCNDVAVPIDLDFTPDFFWAPHLAPEDGYCIAQHVFRSPALIATRGHEVLVLVPDLDICGKKESTPWYMDVDAPNKRFTLGLSLTEMPTHVLYKKKPGMVIEPGTLELGFYVSAYTDKSDPVDPWRRVTEFLWTRYGHPLLAQGQPSTTPMDRYVEHTYRWAFDTWRDSVWQEFELNGHKVGSPCFIVNVTQSPNYKGPINMRETLSVWNQAWFSSLRAASGVYRYAKRTGNTALLEKANLTKEFSLAAPMHDGVFPTVYATGMFKEEVNGDAVYRSKGWQTGHWTNSNRVPRERGLTPDWYHVLDMSWTCLLMVRWHEQLDPDPRLIEYARTYGDKLLTLQENDGCFPAWLDPHTLAPSDVLRESPETSMSVTFLLALSKVTNDDRYRKAALKAMDAVLLSIVPVGRWEGFETYWSCCGWGREEYLGKKIPRNDQYKQCNFSIFWTAEALLASYHATKDEKYLRWGRRTLDELSMYQQIWQPPYIYIPALGGFGVMNVDGEWNDARQSLFAELYMDYYRECGESELFERGIAALKASFVMMYCPENPQQKELWEKVWPFFGPKDYGFMMENYGHTGATSRSGLGIGDFTIYTWGNGAASEARNRIFYDYGDIYIDRARGQAFGIDGVTVTRDAKGWQITDSSNQIREIRIVFDDGHSGQYRIKGKVHFDEKTWRVDELSPIE